MPLRTFMSLLTALLFVAAARLATGKLRIALSLLAVAQALQFLADVLPLSEPVRLAQIFVSMGFALASGVVLYTLYKR